MSEQMSSVVSEQVLNAPIDQPAHAPESVADHANEEKAEEVDYSKRFSELTKKERALIEKQRQIKEASKKLDEYEMAKKNAKLNPKAFMEAHGLSYAEITEFLLNDEKPKEETLLKSKIEEIERQLQEERESKDRLKKEQQEALELKVVTDLKNEISTIIKDDKYEFIQLHGEDGIDLVYSVMEEHFDKFRDMISKEDACDKVEAYLENELKSKYKESKKVKSWWQESTPKTLEVDFEKREWESPTLTNKGTLSTPSVEEPKRTFDDDETSKRKAAQKLQAYWDSLK